MLMPVWVFRIGKENYFLNFAAQDFSRKQNISARWPVAKCFPFKFNRLFVYQASRIRGTNQIILAQNGDILFCPLQQCVFLFVMRNKAMVFINSGDRLGQT